MDHDVVHEYLRRIGAHPPVRPDADALRDLHRRHLETVPFENLSIHLGEPIVLEREPLVDKIVRRRRGGFCYELNGAFGALLEALGFRVTLLAAGVFDRNGHRRPPFDHMALRVDLERPWLADVGFGRHTRHPLLLDTTDAQHDPDGVFRIVPVDDGTGDLDVCSGDDPQYRMEARPRRLIDFTPFCWHHQTSPDSHFTQQVTCSLPTDTGRVTLSGHKLIRTEGTTRTEQTLTDPEALTAYRELFGIELDHIPTPVKTPGAR
ncbi:arylamine N-acetyltransferase [Nocardia sp. NPDC052566]|uniref:arylamine N-acetyltransferase n=1 Tax=Nocardia sp. NPDC052566 TaxID=3364330 RepID=UPI0037C63E3A